MLSGLADILWGAALGGQAAAAAADAAGAAAAAAASPGGASCTVALLPPEMLPFEGTAAELQACVLRERVSAHSWAEAREVLSTRRAALESPQGALSFLYSALLSRGLARFGRERDDGFDPLVSVQFGHCAQEVLNLLLVGRGVSNVFDGDRDLGGMIMRGVSERPPVGLLSEHEALRYVEVGALCKRPSFPIWIVASESHYSVLFALAASVQDTSALASIEDELLRAFSTYDQEGNGFIAADKLSSLISSLPEVDPPPFDELKRDLDPEEISLITWERFRAVVLPLHRQAASLLGPQSDAAVAAADAAAAAHDPAATLELLYFNGLTGRGHAGKGLRAVHAEPGAARNQPMDSQGLAACVQTRWLTLTLTLTLALTPTLTLTRYARFAGSELRAGGEAQP